MNRRAASLAIAAALASGALVAGPAAADAVCVTNDEGTFAGSVVCADTNSATNGSIPVPYYVGPICVAGVCTDPIGGTVYVPRPNGGVVRLYGTLCYRITPRNPQVCRNFDTGVLIGALVLPDITRA